MIMTLSRIIALIALWCILLAMLGTIGMFWLIVSDMFHLDYRWPALILMIAAGIHYWRKGELN